VNRSWLRPASLVLVLAALAGCISVPPQPSPASPITPAPPPTARQRAETPPVFCDPVPAESQVTCEAAVAAAYEVLPPDHLPIIAIEFGYGGCPRGWRCRAGRQDGIQPRAYVLFYTAARGPQSGWVVLVAADGLGNVRATSNAIPYPPAMITDLARSQYADQALRRIADRLRERRGPTMG
jgi:hypothetical protein